MVQKLFLHLHLLHGQLVTTCKNLAVVDQTLDFRLEFRFHCTVKLISIKQSCKSTVRSSITFLLIYVILLGLMWATNLREQCFTESFLMASVTQ